MRFFKEIRKEKGCSQQEFADYLGVPRATYASWERRVYETPSSVLPAAREFSGWSISRFYREFEDEVSYAT